MGIKKILNDYHELIKSKQTLLLLATCIFAYLMSAIPLLGPTDSFDWLELFLLSFSTFIAISGTTVLNMYIDRNIDAKMENGILTIKLSKKEEAIDKGPKDIKIS